MQKKPTSASRGQCKKTYLSQMKNFTKLSLFSDSTNSERQKVYESMTQFVSRELYLLPQIIGDAYSETNDELGMLSPHARRRNSRPVRVNEKIAQKCAEIYPQYFREVSSGKFMLYIPEFAQFHIVKTNRGKLPPRRTRQAQNEVYQQNLPFKDCPILHIGHDHQYGHTCVTLMLYDAGQCVWNCSFSDILYQQNSTIEQPISLPQAYNNSKEVFAKPKANAQKKMTIEAI